MLTTGSTSFNLDHSWVPILRRKSTPWHQEKWIIRVHRRTTSCLQRGSRNGRSRVFSEQVSSLPGKENEVAFKSYISQLPLFLFLQAISCHLHIRCSSFDVEVLIVDSEIICYVACFVFARCIHNSIWRMTILSINIPGTLMRSCRA